MLVTGGAGFIGANFVRRRIEANDRDRVVVIDRRQRKRRQLPDTVLDVMHFECRVIDSRDTQCADRTLDRQRVAVQRVTFILAEVGLGRAREEQRGEQDRKSFQGALP